MIVINGVQIDIPGSRCAQGLSAGANVSIVGDVVYIDGQPVDGEGQDKGRVVKIVVEGPAINVSSDRASIEVKGDVQGNVKAGGSVSCGNVEGGVVGDSVNCENVGGFVQAGGSVNCENVGGDVTSGGRVNRG